MEAIILKKRLKAMTKSFNDERLRWLIGKGKSLVDDGKITRESYELVIKNILQTELERNLILYELRSQPLVVSEIASLVDLPPKTILRHLISLRKDGVVSIKGERNDELEFQHLKKPLDSTTLSLIPDNLRKTALMMINLRNATAKNVADKTGEDLVLEKIYLERLVELGYLKVLEQDGDIFFHV